ncbi:hypothetical protein NE865_15601 [Phthorimaea operculella]|nr:hypothetical protein NE865_15601 [Phthorimaea operculella]
MYVCTGSCRTSLLETLELMEEQPLQLVVCGIRLDANLLIVSHVSIGDPRADGGAASAAGGLRHQARRQSAVQIVSLVSVGDPRADGGAASAAGSCRTSLLETLELMEEQPLQLVVCGIRLDANLLFSFLNLCSTYSFDLLGSPIFPEAIPDAFRARERLLVVTQERLRSLSAHIAMTLLRSCFAVPKINYFLRTVPTWLCPVEVQGFDGALKDAVERILNVSLSVTQWEQAALPIRHGGLGIRRAVDVGLPAFIASAHGVVNLVTNILPLNGDRANIPFTAGAMEAWTTIHTTAVVPDTPEAQRSWDQIGAKRILDQLIEGAIGSDLARLRAVSQPESGAWLHALPSPHIGTLLDGDSLRVAVALRLGCDVCEKHLCICGSMVEANGHHALSCCRCSGRFPRHHALNDILRRALISANIPNVLEPPGLSRMDGKRPDGLTMVPWKKGRCLLWDATCISTFAASHLGRTTRSAGAAAELAAVRKRENYSALKQRYLFVPFAVETTGCWGSEAKAFVKDIGCRLRERGCDPRSGSFLVQRLSIAIQRGNAASVMGTFAPGMSRGGFLTEIV